MNSTALTILHPSLRRAVSAVLAAVTLAFSFAAEETGPPIKVGIIGLDAHAVPWTKIIHDPRCKPPISQMRIVAAVAAPSADIPFSQTNIEQNVSSMRQFGVEILNSVDDLVRRVDAVMILSIDGRPHLEQAKPVFAQKKPLFMDKPIAASLAGIISIFDAAQKSGTPIFSNSALRYGPATVGLGNDSSVGRVLGCDTFCNGQSILPEHPDLFYYGIHGTDMLFAIMGPGCQTVTRIKTPTADVVTGLWPDGRIGTFRGIRQGQVGFGATVFGEKQIVRAGRFEGYEPLLVEIARFFQSGKAPISVEETLEIYAFLEAADESLRQDGKPISIQSTLEKARRQQAGR